VLDAYSDRYFLADEW